MQKIRINIRSSEGDGIALKKRKRSPLPSDFTRYRAESNQEIGGQQRSEGQSVIVAAS
ncbi:hypothetical protein ACP8HI_06805 [Paenibacillus sp. FA6]|uniref:hypothetical protein n=1 Tax=Paenibacillus sp. FA6 TaxID=3413029 RepID=UPI003F65921B